MKIDRALSAVRQLQFELHSLEVPPDQEHLSRNIRDMLNKTVCLASELRIVKKAVENKEAFSVLRHES